MEREKRMLDGINLVSMLHLPRYLRQAIASANQVYTLAEPPKFFGQGSVVGGGSEGVRE
ncbi:MAG: hypothetical protein QNJ63_07570 [Calothrix sp. MO_192.B10]|nr:hypothetical protein [Calothrix sp. MO_192.B10]